MKDANRNQMQGGRRNANKPKFEDNLVLGELAMARGCRGPQNWCEEGGRFMLNFCSNCDMHLD